jgi:hypothetical protein
MCNTSSAGKRRHRALDARDLPLVCVAVLVNGFSGEKRTAATGTLGDFLKPRFGCSGTARAVLITPVDFWATVSGTLDNMRLSSGS